MRPVRRIRIRAASEIAGRALAAFRREVEADPGDNGRIARRALELGAALEHLAVEGGLLPARHDRRRSS